MSLSARNVSLTLSGASLLNNVSLEVLPGQVAPPSCDLRIELETGKEFARNKPSTGGTVEVAEEAEPLDAAAAAVLAAEKTTKMYDILMGLPVRATPPAACLKALTGRPLLTLRSPPVAGAADGAGVAGRGQALEGGA